MRKVRFVAVAVALAAMVTVGAFANGQQGGGGGAAAPAASGGTSGGKLHGSINFWMQQYGADPSYQVTLLKDLTAKFKEKYGVTVNYTIVDWGNANAKYQMAATGGDAPDVADTFFAYSWVQMGHGKYGPMIIDDVVKDVNADSFYKVADSECYINGHWYGLPWRGDIRAAMYNQQMFDQAGIKEFPKTYDELIADGKKLTTYNPDGTVDRAGFLFGQSNARFDQTWFTLLAGFGGTLMDKDYKNWTFDNQAGKDSLQFMYDAVFKYHIVPKACIDPSYNSSTVFRAGKAAIVLGAGNGEYDGIKVNAPQILPYVKSAVMPNKTGSGISSIAFTAPVCVYQTTKNPDAAKAWLKYFCVDSDNQFRIVKTLSLVSAWKGVMANPYYTQDPWFKNYVAQLGRSQPGDMPNPKFSECDAFPNGPLNTMCTEVMAGGDIQKAMDECMGKINTIMAR
jgi:multiple sugar transport system substrate-binding protein